MLDDRDGPGGNGPWDNDPNDIFDHPWREQEEARRTREEEWFTEDQDRRQREEEWLRDQEYADNLAYQESRRRAQTPARKCWACGCTCKTCTFDYRVGDAATPCYSHMGMVCRECRCPPKAARRIWLNYQALYSNASNQQNRKIASTVFWRRAFWLLLAGGIVSTLLGFIAHTAHLRDYWSTLSFGSPEISGEEVALISLLVMACFLVFALMVPVATGRPRYYRSVSRWMLMLLGWVVPLGACGFLLTYAMIEFLADPVDLTQHKKVTIVGLALYFVIFVQGFMTISRTVKRYHWGIFNAVYFLSHHVLEDRDSQILSSGHKIDLKRYDRSYSIRCSCGVCALRNGPAFDQTVPFALLVAACHPEVVHGDTSEQMRSLLVRCAV